MAGLSGISTTGVGSDIVAYLKAVAEHFNVTLVVTSGFRDAAAQGRAMFDNWIKLQRGLVYAQATLPSDDRKALDDFYNAAHDAKATAQARAQAQSDFLGRACAVVGTKSRHAQGRAVDVAQSSVTQAVYRALTRKMTEVREGRDDIYHFESVGAVAPVDDADRAAWGPPATAAVAMSAGVRFLVATAGAMPCTCRA